jgi:hypothetical protein
MVTQGSEARRAVPTFVIREAKKKGRPLRGGLS